MSAVRRMHDGTLLLDGRVLMTGGSDSLDPNSTLATAEVYDPDLETFTPTGSMHARRVGHTQTLLSDGTVLVAGGLAISFTAPWSTAELYGP